MFPGIEGQKERSDVGDSSGRCSEVCDQQRFVTPSAQTLGKEPLLTSPGNSSWLAVPGPLQARSRPSLLPANSIIKEISTVE
jgi:hypothetical protein